MTIHIEDLTFPTIIGMLDFEREKEQNVILNLEIDYNYTQDNFINYADVTEIIGQHIKYKKYHLLEDALYGMEELLRVKYSISKLYIKIIKPDILSNCSVGLSKTWNY